MDSLWVALGGGLGATARYVLGGWVVARLGSGFPFHTLLINVTGSLAIGVLLVLLTERLVVDPAWRLLLVVGFLGGYTTFPATRSKRCRCSRRATGWRRPATSSAAMAWDWSRRISAWCWRG
jgi:CrcB protein